MIFSRYAHKTMLFPAGEMHVQVLNPEIGARVNVRWEFKENSDIIELLLYCNALREAGMKLGELTIPYVPFGRQDRVAVPGECFSLRVFCFLVNTLGAEQVIVYDPHSDVIPALIHKCRVIPQWEIFSNTLIREFRERGVSEKFYLISPDGGALKKIYKLAPLVSQFCLGVIECSKLRNVETGAISGTKVHTDIPIETAVIVDDICDGGRTFTEIAKVLISQHETKKVILCVTHGLFTQGLEVFDGLIDEIYTLKGRIK